MASERLVTSFANGEETSSARAADNANPVPSRPMAGPPPLVAPPVVSPRAGGRLVRTAQAASVAPKLTAPTLARRRWLDRYHRPTLSGLASLVLHAVAVVALGLYVAREAEPQTRRALLVATERAPENVLEKLEPEPQRVERDKQTVEATSPATDALTAPAISAPFEAAIDSARQVATRPLAMGVETAIASKDLLTAFDADVRGGLAGRAPDMRARLALDHGGSDKSEAAVKMGLNWLVAHQMADGSWHFDHTQGLCQGLCRDPGSATSTTGSTALALLAFLGSGHTHKVGDYQDVVQRGLYYLCDRMRVTANGGDLQEGTMYAQGISAIALCEAYALSRDAALETPAQQSLDYIVYAQDPIHGGWRYTPRQPGDTTVTGWQLMALKSGQMAYLRVPPETIALAIKFLDSVQSDRGARYGYTSAGKDLTTTSVGLLMRMYTGWRPDNAALERGVKILSKEGPSRENMYFNYYGTQVMHHWGGEPWQIWNYQLRDFLTDTQARQGHESGSWYFPGGYGDKGGRLYNTALCILMLEVYYRHMPLFRADAANDSY